MENDKAVIKPETNSPAEMIRAAITERTDLDKLEKLLTLQERWEANEAKKTYTKALSEFKCEVPDIKRDKQNKQYNSTYASKGNLIKTITPILSKFGLSANFSYKNLPERFVEVTCRLTHQQGHSEEVSFSAPADVSGAKNPIQQLKSTTTYLEKITFAGILGIESNEEVDDDGRTAGAFIELIGDKELTFIRDNLLALDAPEKQLCDYLKIDKLENLLKSDYQKAVVAIEQKQKLAKKATVKK